MVSYAATSHWTIIIPTIGFAMLFDFDFHAEKMIQDKENTSGSKPNARVCYNYRYIY